jgi:hypothetical protein
VTEPPSPSQFFGVKQLTTILTTTFRSKLRPLPTASQKAIAPPERLFTMSTPNGVYASGASKDDANIRQRNVQSYEKANGGAVYKVEAEDTKKLEKV